MSLRKLSYEYYERAKRVLPGGVNSPVRSARAVGTHPLFIREAKGAWIWDEDGNRYIDYVCSWGPLILGHSHPKVVEAIKEAAERGTSYGIPCKLEVEMAEQVVKMVPSIEVVRFVNSGTEAVMSAIRLARAVTGRKKIIKFDGCYHGHVDALLVKAGSGVATFGMPASAGVPEEVVAQTIVLPYNDLEAVRSAMELHGKEIAAIIVEPVAGNMGVVPPVDGFLRGLRELCEAQGALLIFDEVITGFRLTQGGAQQYYGVYPDITCLGKIIGGGLPVGAYGASVEIMAHVAPDGQMYQAGTLSGNPLAMAAGLTTLRILEVEGIYEELNEKAAYLERGLKEVAENRGVTITVQRVGSMGCGFFTDRSVKNFDEVKTCNTEAYGVFFRAMLDKGVYLAPSQFEAFFVSYAHTMEDLDKTIEAAHYALKKVLESGY
ncbi:MAG: glutamate-1-semialdehyde 2,1-aminomutase [Syntrophobacterales bacterium]|nr:glutamate-1-semialdehyde 2,1-aminomutase [Syntrophobacterales bacterium]